MLVAEAVPTVKLNNGVDMPILAFGAQVWDADTCTSATAAALKAGFRFIWSSMLIGSPCQAAQWKAIQASSVALSDIFVGGTVNTQSCTGTNDCYLQTKAGAESQFQILAKNPLDMLMLDYPSGGAGCDGVLGQWKAFEEFYAAKQVMTIAVSNFSPEQLKCITSNTSATVPSVNQMPFSVGHGTDTVIADDGVFGVFVQAYSPLSGLDSSDALLTKIGKAHNKSWAQVGLKWIAQRNVTINTQSTKMSHLQEDVDIFDFTLSHDEMSQLNAHSEKQLIV
jgi:diketogulonate reductase-like aldo/keto reductase